MCVHSIAASAAVLDNDEIGGGGGLIANDFNARQDLWPYLAALHIEEAARGHAYRAILMKHARIECVSLGFQNLYLATDHTGYYERYGWEFIGTFAELSGGTSRLYRASALSG